MYNNIYFLTKKAQVISNEIGQKFFVIDYENQKLYINIALEFDFKGNKTVKINKDYLNYYTNKDGEYYVFYLNEMIENQNTYVFGKKYQFPKVFCKNGFSFCVKKEKINEFKLEDIEYYN